MKVVIFRSSGYLNKALGVEVRIGYQALAANHPKTAQITLNTVCGQTTSRSGVQVESLPCARPLDGRYVTLQSLVDAGILVGEVNIYIRGICPHAELSLTVDI